MIRTFMSPSLVIINAAIVLSYVMLTATSFDMQNTALRTLQSRRRFLLSLNRNLSASLSLNASRAKHYEAFDTDRFLRWTE